MDEAASSVDAEDPTDHWDALKVLMAGRSNAGNSAPSAVDHQDMDKILVLHERMRE